jgi:hypothetical protein
MFTESRTVVLKKAGGRILGDKNDIERLSEMPARDLFGSLPPWPKAKITLRQEHPLQTSVARLDFIVDPRSAGADRGKQARPSASRRLATSLPLQR